MTAFCVRGALVWLFAAVVIAAAPALAEEPITVHLDQAKILKLPDRATTVVIGDPLIADMSIQPGGLAVLTGKGYGETNVVVLDKSSAVLMEKTIEVKAPAEPLIMVYRGQTRQTYSCTPLCSPRITLGDTSKADIDVDTQLPSDYFSKTLTQSVTRNNQALAAGGAH
ncbi:MAG: pilus assembly protein N-terminal domain-containing protein [Xanthobacteraceae bacterium]